MADNTEHVQDPSFPPDWHAWETSHDRWHARPPGPPRPSLYVHAETKQACADKAWKAHRLKVDAESQV